MRLASLGSLVLAVLLGASFARADVPPGTPYVESATHPIRVYYEAPAPKSQADSLLTMCDEAWDAEIGEMGFAQPLRVLDGNIVPGFHMTIRKAGADVAYTFEVLGDNPATPETDCPILGIANTDFLKSGNYYQDTAWHVLNHASLHAVDCLEKSVPTNDIFTIGAQMTRGTVPADYLQLENDTFQGLPEYSLDAVGSGADDAFYSFGSALYALFLDERFGQRDAKLLVEIWKHTAEPGHITGVSALNSEMVSSDVENIPTWFDAIATVLATKGSSFDQAYQEFAIWRLLVGSYADGKHYKDAASYPLPAFNQTVDPTTLPLVKAHPTKRVARYGTSYVRVDSPKLAAGKALKLTFTGFTPFKWAVQVLCILANQDPEITPLTLNGSSTGTGFVPSASRCKAVVLAVENLSEGGFVPDTGNNSLDGDYQVSVVALAMPTLTSLSPVLLHPGDDGVQLTAKGTQFVSGASLGAVFSGDGIEVTKVDLVDDLTLGLTVKVAVDAPTGVRDLTLTNGNGLSAKLAGAVNVQVAPDAGAPGPDASVEGLDAEVATGPDAGGAPPVAKTGGCSSASNGMVPLFAALAGLLCLAWRRRESAGD